MTILIKILPVILLFIAGFLLKQFKMLKKIHADYLLKFVFFITLPLLMFISVLKIELTIQMVYISIIPFIIVAIIFITSFFWGKRLNLVKKDLGVFLVGTMIMNVGFTYPFIIAAYGEAGLARISFFNFTNSIIAFTFVYYFACYYGNGVSSYFSIFKKLLRSMPIWALIVAIIFNLCGWNIPLFLEKTFRTVGSLTIPLVMLSLGVYFVPKFVNPKAGIAMLITRHLFGFILGIALVTLFNLKGLDKIIVLIGTSAPVGYNTLIFSTIENLNKEFAASIVSISIFIGIIYIPLLMFFFTI